MNFRWAQYEKRYNQPVYATNNETVRISNKYSSVSPLNQVENMQIVVKKQRAVVISVCLYKALSIPLRDDIKYIVPIFR